MFKFMGKEINAIFGAQSILIWTYALVLKKSRPTQWSMKFQFHIETKIAENKDLSCF